MQFAHGFKTKTAKCATANIDCFGEIISWVNYGFYAGEEPFLDAILLTSH